MKVLLLAPTYLDLYKPIKEELERQGNEVVFIEDETPSFYPYYRKSFVKSFVYKCLHLFRNLNRLYEGYWKRIIDEKNLLQQHFDVFFCINGTSLHPFFIEKLTSNNPNLHKSLYLWDTNKYYDFERFVPYFDKCYTFDYEDAEKIGIDYLPIYYVANNESCEEKYDAFCIGTLHDNRLEILKKIAFQMDKFNLSYCFKVVYSPVASTVKNTLLYYLSYLFETETTRIETEYKMGKRRDALLTTSVIPLDEYNRLMSQSRVIIDTDRESQNGLTPRLVWAIASGKTIITTNKNLKGNPYCPKTGFWIIDRENPIIEKEMFLADSRRSVDNKVKELELANWVKFFINN